MSGFGRLLSDGTNLGGNISIGGAVTNGTNGSVLFIDGSGNVGQDNARFFWDNTNHRLGIGTAAPGTLLEVSGSNTNFFQITNTATSQSWFFNPGSDSVFRFYLVGGTGRISANNKCWVRIGGNGDGDGNLAQLHVRTDATGSIGLIVDTPASPTVNLQEWRINTTPTSVVDPNGRIGALTATPGYAVEANGDISSNATGKGFRVKQGTNCKQGLAQLASGAVTVATTAIGASSHVFVGYYQASGTIAVTAYMSARTAGASFNITASATDNSLLSYFITDPS